MTYGKVGTALVAALLIAGSLSSTASAATRGGWPDLTWTYIYEAQLGQDVAGALGAFSDLDGSWDSDNVYNLWFGDKISDPYYPGGVEALTRPGLGDNESGAQATDAQTLGILDFGDGQNNNSIYFERFLTDGGNTGGGSPTIDFANGVTIIARFRFFSMDTLMPNRDDQSVNEPFRRSLGIATDDDGSIWAFLNPYGVSMAKAGGNEYDEGPREMLDAPNGMFMVSRGDVYSALGGGPGGIYFGMDVDGDDSWDPSTFTTPPPAIAPRGVKVAYILRGPENANVPFQMSDKRVIDRLRARGIAVTVLDHGHDENGTFTGGHMSYTNGTLTGPAAVAADHDLVILSSTIGSGNVGAGYTPDRSYRPYNVPLITWESGLGKSKGYGLANDGGTVFPHTDITIASNTHPVTAGLPTGQQPLFAAGSPQRNLSLVGFSLPPAATQLAYYPGNTSLTVLAAYDPNVGGGVMSEGSPLASNQRYVFLPLEDDTFWALNATGIQIFDQAVDWALGPAKASLLVPAYPAAGSVPLPPAPPASSAWKPSFYISLGATPLYAMGGNTMYTRVLKGRFFSDTTSADPTVPAVGGDTKVWADLPAGSMSDFLSVYITVEPEAAPPPGSPLPAHRVKVYFDGSSTPVIEIKNHHLDPSLVPAVGNGGLNDGTGLGMGLWRVRAGGYLDVDYFGVKDGVVPPPGTCNTPPQDSDGDGDVDLADFSIFQACFNGPNRPFNADSAPEGKCACMDVDPSSGGDGDVDLADFGRFQGCFNGPNRPPACAS
jgi:hypothetical protein